MLLSIRIVKGVSRSSEIVAGVLLFMLCVVLSHGQRLCPPGTYWDTVIDKCDSCYSICYMAEIQGTVDTCKKKCPGFLKPVNDRTEISEHDERHLKYDPPLMKAEGRMSAGLIAFVCIACVAVGAALVGIVIIWRSCTKKEEMKYPIQAEDRTPYPGPGPEQQTLV
ncbi:uncharacterized protein LOC121379374 [Gigantopelta aegis]|uniref:uncharacterized protein LOC121379374 n=1 Tax=Gigantopelta aegis TaxID=1735272 RepID=UPI001B88DD70|nr:uncharacterized protein LOC121379374 [Gigantopelta aegis]